MSIGGENATNTIRWHAMVKKVTIDRVILIVFDSLGDETTLAEASDEDQRFAVSSVRTVDSLRLPNLERLGLGNVLPIEGVARMATPLGACGRLTRRASHDDPRAGYWELAGLDLEPAGQCPEFRQLPPRPTVLDALKDSGLPVVGIGQISDVFADRGVVEKVGCQGNTDGMIKIIEAMTRCHRGLFMIHLDHDDDLHRKRSPRYRNSPLRSIRCLEEFDVQLAMLLSRAADSDLVLLTAEHGPAVDRSGLASAPDVVPILAVGPPKAAGIDLGTRRSLADVAATIAEIFGVEPPEAGDSFLADIS